MRHVRFLLDYDPERDFMEALAGTVEYLQRAFIDILADAGRGWKRWRGFVRRRTRLPSIPVVC